MAGAPFPLPRPPRPPALLPMPPPTKREYAGLSARPPARPRARAPARPCRPSVSDERCVGTHRAPSDVRPYVSKRARALVDTPAADAPAATDGSSVQQPPPPLLASLTAAEGVPVTSSRVQWHEHTAAANVVRWAPGPGSSLLATASMDHTVRIYSPAVRAGSVRCFRSHTGTLPRRAGRASPTFC